MTFLQTIYDYIDARINPITVKELRQITRSQSFWSVFITFVLLQSGILIMAFDLKDYRSSSYLIIFLFAALFFVSFLLIPLNCGFRFARELFDCTEELLYTTTITPRSIVIGKVAASIAVVLLVNSVFAPFIAITFFLGGVNLGASFIMLFIGVIASAASTMFQIVLGALSKVCNCFYIFRVVAVILQLYIYVTLSAIIGQMSRFDSPRIHFLNFDSWYLELIILFIFSIILVYVMFTIASGLISPTGTNKMYPVRLSITVLWLTSLFVSMSAGMPELVLSCTGAFIIFFSLWSIVSISERDHLTERVAREIPVSKIGRFLSFIFYSGSAGGITWCSFMAMFNIFLNIFYRNIEPSIGGIGVGLKMAVIFGYFLGYSLIALAIHRRFLINKINICNTWLVGIAVWVCVIIFPLIVGAISGIDDRILEIGNPLLLRTTPVITSFLDEPKMIYVAILIAIGILLNLSLFKKQFMAHMKKEIGS